MLRIFYLKWFFCGFIIIQQIYAFHATETQNQETIDQDTHEPIDWTGLLTDLRGSWQSPLSYLQKRGYLPPGNENLLKEKLDELRAMKTEDTEEKLNENIEEEEDARINADTISETDKLQHGKPQVASELKDTSVSNLGASDASNPTASLTANNNHVSVANYMLAKNAPHAQYQTNTNNDEPLVTYASRQQLTNELQEDLYKGLTEDLNADVEKDTEQEAEADADSYENQIANVKSSSTTGIKSRGKSKKKKCKAKSKTKSKASQAKPGFFQNLKQKFSTMFGKSDKVAESKKPIQNKKLALSPDFASYYVRYLAHKDTNHETNGLSLNDVTGEYTSVRYYGDSEMSDGGKGLYRRDGSDKDLTFKEFNSEDIAMRDANDKNEKSNIKAADMRSKDLALREFPFKDFSLGDLDMKKLQTNALKSDSNERVNAADMKNFDSKDEELNALVHSLAEQQTSDTKGLQALKSVKSTTKDDGALKSTLTASKDEALDDNANIITKSFSLKKYTPTFTQNTDTSAVTKDFNAKADYLSDFEQPNSDAKSAYSDSYGDLIKRINLKDFDFNLPDLGLNGLATKTNRFIPSTKQFGNLGMPSSKIKALEDDAVATTSLQNEKDTNESSLSRLGDFGVNAALANENNYARRELVANNKLAADNQNEDDSDAEDEDDSDNDDTNQVALKKAPTNDFDWRSLSTTAEDSNLELDRQFTRQVLEKVMRDAAQNNAAAKA